MYIEESGSCFDLKKATLRPKAASLKQASKTRGKRILGDWTTRVLLLHRLLVHKSLFNLIVLLMQELRSSSTFEKIAVPVIARKKHAGSTQ